MAYSEPGGEGGLDATDRGDRVSIGSATDDDDEDEFELLKKKRDEERQSRLVRVFFLFGKFSCTNFY